MFNVIFELHVPFCCPQAESGSVALYYLHLNKNYSDSLLNVKGLLSLHSWIEILSAELSLQNSKYLYRTEELKTAGALN